MLHTIKKIDESAAIISPDKFRIIHSKGIPSGVEYKKKFTDIRTCDITNRVYLILKLKLTHTGS